MMAKAGNDGGEGVEEKDKHFDLYATADTLAENQIPCASCWTPTGKDSTFCRQFEEAPPGYNFELPTRVGMRR